MFNLITRFLREEDGMEFVEWSLVAVLFALVGITAWEELGQAIIDALDQIESDIEGATP